MKKISTKIGLAAVLAAAMLFAFAGCDDGSKNVDEPASDPTIVDSDLSVDFTTATITEAYGNSSLISLSGTTLTITAGSWDSFTIALPSTIDISSKTKMVVTANYSGDYTDPDAMVIGFVDSADVQARADSWTVSGFMNPLTDTATAYEYPIEKISNMEYRDGGDTTGFNNAAISKIVIDPRGASGNIVITSITFE